MKFSTKDRYALRLMVELARSAPDEFLPLKTISARQQISLKYLEQIVTPLARAGLVVSGRGSQGGYRLTVPASEITAGDVLRAIEGEIVAVPCLSAEAEECPRQSECHTLAFWTGLNDAINNYIDHAPLSELCGAHV